MIINFSFQNFRSVKEKIALSFEASHPDELHEYYIAEPKAGLRLLKVGLIFGANASGKTTILLALDFLRKIVLEPLEKRTEEFDFTPFLFDPETPTKKSSFALEFVHNQIKYSYEVELSQRTIFSEKLYYHNPNKALVYERTTDAKKQLTQVQFGGKIKINREHKAILEANTLWNNTVLGGYLKTNFESSELQEVIDWFTNTLKPIIKPGQNLFHYVSSKIESEEINKRNVVEFLKKADFKISDIILGEEDNNMVREEHINFLSKALALPGNKLNEIWRAGKLESKEVFFQHKVEGYQQYKLAYSEESAGTQRYYQFSGLLDLMMRNATVFSIDELEASLHPDLLKHFLLAFLANAKHSQLIATTHYRELLMERDIYRNDVIWFTEKKEDGSTDLFSLTDFDSSVVRNTSSVFNAYKIGKLGAVPDLGDYYIDREDGEE